MIYNSFSRYFKIIYIYSLTFLVLTCDRKIHTFPKSIRPFHPFSQNNFSSKLKLGATYMTKVYYK